MHRRLTKIVPVYIVHSSVRVFMTHMVEQNSTVQIRLEISPYPWWPSCYCVVKAQLFQFLWNSFWSPLQTPEIIMQSILSLLIGRLYSIPSSRNGFSIPLSPIEFSSCYILQFLPYTWMANVSAILWTLLSLIDGLFHAQSA